MFNFVFDSTFGLTRAGTLFLQIDEKVNGRLMLFRDLDFMLCSFQVAVNQIFKWMENVNVINLFFYQLYVVYGNIHSYLLHLFYAFLENKTEALYSRLIGRIKDLLNSKNINFALTSFMIDFEYAMLNAIKIIF